VRRRPTVALAILVSLASAAAASIAAAGVILGIDHFQSALDEARIPDPTVGVLLAAREVPMGYAIAAEDLVTVQMPVGALRVGSLDPSLVVGRVATERLIVGEAIREERLAPPLAGHDLEALLARGMRAQSVNLANADTVSGFLNPGDRVDVIATLAGLDDVAAETRTILHGVRILGIDDRILASEERGIRLKAQVTLEVSPSEAELLAHGDRVGELRLVVIGLYEPSSRVATR
jgi:pilus assembly protein CpaB